MHLPTTPRPDRRPDAPHGAPGTPPLLPRRGKSGHALILTLDTYDKGNMGDHGDPAWATHTNPTDIGNRSELATKAIDHLAGWTPAPQHKNKKYNKPRPPKPQPKTRRNINHRTIFQFEGRGGFRVGGHRHPEAAWRSKVVLDAEAESLGVNREHQTQRGLIKGHRESRRSGLCGYGAAGYRGGPGHAGVQVQGRRV